MLSTETLDDIKRRAIEISNEIEAKSGPFYAEIVEDCLPLWHLIETFPNQEAKAVEFLSERAFGVFLPKFDDTATLKLGDVELCSGRRLIFPGHLFIFVWDIARHWRRIKACPGVLRILMDRPEHPVVVPDSAMDFIQALQFGLSPRPRMTKRRKGKTKHQQANTPENGEESVTITTPSFWNKVTRLDGDGRNGLLHKALGLEMLTSTT